MANTYKDFAGWSEYKAHLQTKAKPPFFHEREVWWTAIGHNIGSEEDGKGIKYARPVLIVRKFNQHLFWGIPLTTTQRTGKYYLNFMYTNKRLSTAILSQLKAFDGKRLLTRGGIIAELDFAKIQLGLVNIIRKEPQK